MQFFLEKDSRRPRAIWRLLAQLALFVAATALLSGLFLSVIGVGPGGLSQGMESSPVSLLVSLASLAAIFVSVWLAGRFLDRRPFREFGFHFSGGWWLDLLFGLFLGALLMTVIFLTEIVLGWISVTGSFETIQPGVPFTLAILFPMGAFLSVGIYEEMLSRGYQLRNVAEGLNYPALGPRGAVVIAWALSSSVFGVLHVFNPNATILSTVNIALAGLMLGLGYILTGELAIPIGLHITWNFFEGNVFDFPVSGTSPVGATFVATKQAGPAIWTGGSFGPEAGLIGVAAILFGCVLIMLWLRVRRGKVSLHTPIAAPPKPLLPNGSGPDQTSG